MDTQQRLWTPPVRGLAITARWEYPSGWVLVVRAVREGEEWASGWRTSYEMLTTPELVDVVFADLERVFVS